MAKILLKKLWKKGLEWDENIKEPERGEIINFLTSIFKVEEVFF